MSLVVSTPLVLVWAFMLLLAQGFAVSGEPSEAVERTTLFSSLGLTMPILIVVSTVVAPLAKRSLVVSVLAAVVLAVSGTVAIGLSVMLLVMYQQGHIHFG